MEERLATQINIIRKLDKQDYLMLRELCQRSNSLYNQALYNVRQDYFDYGEYISFYDNRDSLKSSYHYEMLQAGSACETVKMVDQDMKSYFKSLKSDNVDNWVSLPRYKNKKSYYDLIINYQSFHVEYDENKGSYYFWIPISRRFVKEHNNYKPKIKISFPKRLLGAKIKTIRIIPCHEAKYFKVAFNYKWDDEPKQLDKKNVLGIDLGGRNLATCVSSIGTPFIIDGSKLHTINQGWNKHKATLQSKLPKNKHWSNKLENITLKRNNQVRDYINKSARLIVNYCIENNIGTLIIGYTKGWKRSIDLGKIANQNFVDIPHAKLKDRLEFLCNTYHIDYIEQEESYTSKASFLDNDFIPVYKEDDNTYYHFSGMRVHRGLYQSANGTYLNADVNGACNIIRKYERKQNIKFNELPRGMLTTPHRIAVIQ